MYPKKLVKKARKLGYKWLATDIDGYVHAFEHMPRCGDGGTRRLWFSLYEIPPKPIYPKWVIKAAKQSDLKWIATDKNGAVFAFQTKPEHSSEAWYAGRCLLCVKSTCPLTLSVNWTESLYEIPQ